MSETQVDRPRPRPGVLAGAKRRVDPVVRPVDGAAMYTEIENREHGRRYVYVNPGDKAAMATKRREGYQIEIQREGGPRIAMGDTVKDGQEMTMMDQVLMSIDEKRFEQIQREGLDGQGGYARAAKLEKAMLKAPGMENDPGRGRHRSVGNMSVVSESHMQGVED